MAVVEAVEGAVVVLGTEGVAVVAAHGQAESPNFRVKRSHSTDGCDIYPSLPKSWVLGVYVWSRAIYVACAVVTRN